MADKENKEPDLEKQANAPSWDDEQTDITSSKCSTPNSDSAAQGGLQYQSITHRQSALAEEDPEIADEKDDLPALQATPSRLSEHLHPIERTLSELAAYEGHDADIPSNEGYLLSAEGEKQRRQSLSRRRSRNSTNLTNAETPRKSHDSNGTVGEEGEEVWWDGPEDPENPLNWSSFMKWMNIALVSFLVFMTPLASSAFAPGVPDLMLEFHSTSSVLSEFVVSVYVLGFAAGPIVLAPLSELYGRTPVYHVCNLGFLAFTVACAKATTLPMLVGFRFCQGWFGAAPIANGGGTVADVIRQEERGRALAIFSMGPMLGPVIGPVIGGFLNAAAGWRWVFWLVTIVQGILTVLCFIFLRETYAPRILEVKAMSLRKKYNNPDIHSKLDVGLTAKELFRRSIWRPVKMLIVSPITSLLAIYIAFTYGILYLLFTTFTMVFEEQYGFSNTIIGLAFVPMGVGSVIGVLLNAYFSDRILKKRADGGIMKPEYRLPPMSISSLGLPIGLFWYGWTAEYKCHWIVPMLGTMFVGCGNIITFLCAQAYIVDAFTVFAASALAANTIVRSLFGSLLPLAGETMYDNLGYGWGNSLLGFISVALLPIPILFNRYGEALRTKYEFKDI